MSEQLDPLEYLAALDDVRADRASLYPHAHRSADDDAQRSSSADTARLLPSSVCDLGRRRVAELRALIDEQIDRVRSKASGW